MRISRPRAAVVVLTAIAATAGTICAPIIYAKITNVIVDGVHGDDSMAWSHLWWLIGGQSILYVAIFACTITQSRLLATAVQESAHALRVQLGNKLQTLPINHFDSAPRGEYISKITAHTDNATTVLGPVLVTLPTNILSVITVSALLFFISPTLALIALSAAPISTVLAVVVAKQSRPHFTEQRDTTVALSGHVEETLSVGNTLQVYNADEMMARRFAVLNDRLFSATRSAQWVSGTLAPIVTTINTTVFLSLAVVGSLEVIDGALSLGAVQAAILFAQLLNSSMRTIAGAVPRLQSASVSSVVVRELLDTPDGPTPVSGNPRTGPSSTVPERVAHHRRGPEVRFRSVTFKYPDADASALVDVDLTLAPGTTTAIVGATGSGKSTLARLLQGSLVPIGGEVLIDGVPRATAPAPRMAVVPQEPWLFAGSLAANITYGCEVGDACALSDAVAATGLDRIIDRLPAGIDTLLSDDTGTLSEGEKQLVAVARALAARPRILILDEATSAADTHTELLIRQALAHLRTRCTILLITHRLHTAAHADQIVVLEHGRIVETGTHRQLLDRGGRYAGRCRSGNASIEANDDPIVQPPFRHPDRVAAS